MTNPFAPPAAVAPTPSVPPTVRLVAWQAVAVLALAAVAGFPADVWGIAVGAAIWRFRGGDNARWLHRLVFAGAVALVVLGVARAFWPVDPAGGTFVYLVLTAPFVMWPAFGRRERANQAHGGPMLKPTLDPLAPILGERWTPTVEPPRIVQEQTTEDHHTYVDD